jgi:hypothetical protein
MSSLSPQTILAAYWLILLVLAAFALRMACGLCRLETPTWRRAFVSVLVVTFLTYLTFDFTSYLILRSMDGVKLVVPPGYSYILWFREPFNLKWYIVSNSGMLKYLPFVFGLCVAGVLQLIVLQAQVTFRIGLLIFLIQWGATFVAGYILSLLFGVALTSVGWTPPQVATRPAGQVPPRAAHGRPTPPRPGQAAPQQPAAEPSSLEVIEHKAGEVAEGAKVYLANLKAYADSHIEELQTSLEPVTRHLPQPVQDFLRDGGWWWVLGFCAILALLWVRAILRKLSGAVRGLRRKKGKKRRARAPNRLRENLKVIGPGVTEVGPRRLVVKGVPARLRLVVLSLGTQGGGALSAEMADRVLDWIKPGLAAVADYDSPAVRVWPPFYSPDGFATALHNNLRVAPKGTKSPWVVLAGAVRMGRLLIHVGLLLHAEEANSLGLIKVGEQWPNALAIEKTPESALGW